MFEKCRRQGKMSEIKMSEIYLIVRKKQNFWSRNIWNQNAETEMSKTQNAT
jgi:hypothetical protein